MLQTCPVSIDPFLSLGGLFAGIVVGLTGLGGAAIVTPMLLLLFNIPAPVAVSTDVVSAAVMKPVGAGVHIKRRTPYYPVVLWLSLGSVPGVLLGTWLFSVLVGEEGGDTALRRLIGVVLLVAVVVTLLRLRLRKYTDSHGDQALTFSRGKLALASAVGLLVGTLVGLTSVGSGTLIAASLMILFPAMLPSRLVGTDLVQAVPMLVVGAIAHAGLGEIDPTVLFSLLLGQIPGVFIGARISSRYNGQELRWLLLVLVGSAGLALLGAPTWLATTTTVAGRPAAGDPDHRAQCAAPARAHRRGRPLIREHSGGSGARGSAAPEHSLITGLLTDVPAGLERRGIQTLQDGVERGIGGDDGTDSGQRGGRGVHCIPATYRAVPDHAKRGVEDPLVEGVQGRTCDRPAGPGRRQSRSRSCASGGTSTPGPSRHLRAAPVRWCGHPAGTRGRARARGGPLRAHTRRRRCPPARPDSREPHLLQRLLRVVPVLAGATVDRHVEQCVDGTGLLFGAGVQVLPDGLTDHRGHAALICPRDPLETLVLGALDQYLHSSFHHRHAHTVACA
jgi:uncharacterized membrane protein YfcA